ncbi:hypothetical protein D3C86_1436950 [compost metagenome]
MNEYAKRHDASPIHFLRVECPFQIAVRGVLDLEKRLFMTVLSPLRPFGCGCVAFILSVRTVRLLEPRLSGFQHSKELLDQASGCAFSPVMSVIGLRLKPEKVFGPDRRLVILQQVFGSVSTRELGRGLALRRIEVVEQKDQVLRRVAASQDREQARCCMPEPPGGRIHGREGHIAFRRPLSAFDTQHRPAGRPGLLFEFGNRQIESAIRVDLNVVQIASAGCGDLGEQGPPRHGRGKHPASQAGAIELGSEHPDIDVLRLDGVRCPGYELRSLGLGPPPDRGAGRLKAHDDRLHISGLT